MMGATTELIARLRQGPTAENPLRELLADAADAIEDAEENAGWTQIASDTAVLQPNRTELIESMKVTMLGTVDGGFLDADDPIPAWEMFRLAAEWLEAVVLPIPATGEADAKWRKAAEVVLAEVKINGTPALEFIDKVVTP